MRTMKPGRRQFLHLASAAVGLAVVAPTAQAQGYPTRPIRILVGFPAGGTTDINARLIAQWLSERHRQQFIVENRPGANASLALEALVHAPADGYTLGTVGTSSSLNEALHQHADFDLNRDLAMIAGLATSPLVLEVHPSVPVETVPELIAYVKANPGRINMASYGAGSLSHVAGELFKMAAGLHMQHVPYRGSAPMLTDLLGGQVQVAFDALPASIEFIRTARLRVLAVTSASRDPALPQIPCLGEYLPGYEATTFTGIGAPRKISAEIVLKLNKEINAGLADTKMKERLAELGSAPLVLSPADFTKFVQDETEKWGRVIRTPKLSPG
jgi:tripartite-type tricarboxylate transporter receptor subunit TctC